MSRYKLTPRRRSSILKAQRISSRKRSKSSKDTVGYWIGRGIKTVGNKATLGVAGQVAELKELNDAARRRKRRKRIG